MDDPLIAGLVETEGRNPHTILHRRACQDRMSEQCDEGARTDNIVRGLREKKEETCLPERVLSKCVLDTPVYFKGVEFYALIYIYMQG